MVSKRELKERDFSIMEDYYEYIMLSRLNGQNKQSRKLFQKLSTNQKQDFEMYLELTRSSLQVSQIIRQLDEK